jgi:hypothetical protein
MDRYGDRFQDPDKLEAADRIEQLEGQIKMFESIFDRKATLLTGGGDE